MASAIVVSWLSVLLLFVSLSVLVLALKLESAMLSCRIETARRKTDAKVAYLIGWEDGMHTQREQLRVVFPHIPGLHPLLPLVSKEMWPLGLDDAWTMKERVRLNHVPTREVLLSLNIVDS